MDTAEVCLLHCCPPGKERERQSWGIGQSEATYLIGCGGVINKYRTTGLLLPTSPKAVLLWCRGPFWLCDWHLQEICGISGCAFMHTGGTSPNTADITCSKPTRLHSSCRRRSVFNHLLLLMSLLFSGSSVKTMKCTHSLPLIQVGEGHHAVHGDVAPSEQHHVTPGGDVADGGRLGVVLVQPQGHWDVVGLVYKSTSTHILGWVYSFLSVPINSWKRKMCFISLKVFKKKRN